MLILFDYGSVERHAGLYGKPVKESKRTMRGNMSDGALPSRTAILKRQEEQAPEMVCQERKLSYC